MINLKHLKYHIVLILLLPIILGNLFASNTKVNDPAIIMHDTVIAPGELLLQVDAFNFTGDNGQIAAITFGIEIDTFLIQFINIQNTTIAGNWLANYNTYQNEITITYIAPSSSGMDINGKLLDLHLNYFGGFSGDLHFKNNCEITNVNLQTIQNVVYEDGTISQIEALGTVEQDTIDAFTGEFITMPILAEGVGYNMVNQINLRVDYDTTQLEYEGFLESALSEVSVISTESILTIEWEDPVSSTSFTSLDTMVNLRFTFIGESNQSTSFLPGSRILNDGVLVASEFINGYVRAKLLVELINNPDTAGTAIGGGYYFINDLVTITAIPAEGFHFINWTSGGNVISTDSLYSYIKQSSNDTITANYEPLSYDLSLESSPLYGGEVIGEGVYHYGETVSAIAVPNAGYKFIQWMYEGSIVSEDSLYMFTMPNNNMELTAIFDTLEYSVVVTSSNINYGTVTGGGIFNYWDIATVTATPLPDYIFVVWTEEGQPVSTNSIYTFPVQSSRNLVAEFQLDTECSAPVGLYVDNLSETEATLNWFPSGDETEWELLWGHTGFDTISGGTLIQDLTETYYLLQNLDPGTVYDFYVKANCSETISSNWAGPFTFSTWFVGVDMQYDKSEVLIFPNPAKHELKVKFENNKPSKITYRIVNLMGITKLNDEIYYQKQFLIDLDGLPPGSYILQIFNDNRMVSKFFVKE